MFYYSENILLILLKNMHNIDHEYGEKSLLWEYIFHYGL